ncbi:MAG: response regulator [Marinisporobacter sp.]|jgi:YesN/AraC family two-component response regulator|nr:response regulator [Marinisporobacter sp.]
MIKTLLVDDDFLVRMYLNSVTDWRKHGFEIIGDAQNGEDALEKIEKLRPQFIIMDINMPIMDGIELIKEIKKRKYECEIVVLSCHDDFEYVKEALKLGANEYLLKSSFDEQDIVKLLEKIRTTISVQEDEQKREEELLRLADFGSNTIKKEFFLGVIHNHLDDSQIQSIAHKKNIKISVLQTCAIIINFLDQNHNIINNYNEKEELDFYNTFVKMCSEFINSDLKYEIVAISNYKYCIFFDGKDLENKNGLNRIAMNIHLMTERYLNINTYIGVSDMCFGKESIKQSYNHALTAVKHSFYEKQNIYYYNQITPFKEEVPAFYDMFIEDMKKYLIKGEFDYFLKKSQKLIAAFKKEYTQPKLVVKWLKSMDMVLHIVREEDFYKQIFYIEDVEKIVLGYREYVYIKPHIGKNIKNKAVQQAIHYIGKNFNKPISQSMVAEIANVNPAYLSHLFKQEVGINFSDYLTLCRIEYAKELLEKTNCKIKEVSEKCGFHDNRYFCKIFKKSVGVSPTSYRKKE